MKSDATARCPGSSAKGRHADCLLGLDEVPVGLFVITPIVGWRPVGVRRPSCIEDSQGLGRKLRRLWEQKRLDEAAELIAWCRANPEAVLASAWELMRRRKAKAKETARHPVRSLPCIYRGACQVCGKAYIGRATSSPEGRWAAHRKSGTGPFHCGHNDAAWDILEQGNALADPKTLAEREAYYIGLYDSFKRGQNVTRGDDRSAYDSGCAARV